ncbi:hypothetical protein HHI36_014215 [Cryptolaemus montrouzieri]|uniref:DNA-directed RNA polymerase III subunit RPC5 n=1 Tax=Cryptolaemus montrouzieri TaxID=559131 RepID=A0ABD2N262_9CUCU
MAEEPPYTEDDESDDDPVVAEFPVFHSRRLQENLYLFQYPLRAATDKNECNIKKAFFKPQNQEMKLELGIDIECSNFDSGRAEIIAHEVDGPPEKRKPGAEVFFENEIVDKVLLSSTRAVREPEKYAVAAFNGKELHLTTLKGIFQFRPVFPHLEKALKKRKQMEENGNTSSDEEAGPSNAKQVTVKFKQNDERWKNHQSTSFKSLQAKSASEKWLECGWNESDSTISKVQKLKLLAENLEDTNQANCLTDKEYVRLLVPEDQEQSSVEPALPSHVMSLHALRALPLLEQCRLLLKDAQIIQFQQIMMLLAGCAGLTADVLLKTLPKCAVLVRGNWVVKSEVLYPPNTLSATSGVPSDHMCRARDYVLYLFTKHQYVERKKVSSVMKIPAEEVKEIFTGISKLRHNKGWELTLGTDNDFIVKHSDIVQRQTLLWEQRYIQLSDFLKDKKQRRKSKSESKSVSEDTVVKKSAHYNSSDNESGTEKNKSPVVPRKRIKKMSESTDNL